MSFAQQFDSAQTLDDRIALVSKKFLGLPYGTSPLGEGYGIDNDPLIRFDLFDCTTYVETVGALALSEETSVEKTIQTLNEIRYSNGYPSIIKRNHFTSLDWIPNNIRKGILQDITRNLFPNKYTIIETQIDKMNWFQKNFMMTVFEPVTKSRIEVISIQDILRNEGLLNNIPSGSVINFVSNKAFLKERIGTDLDVSHQGFVIRTENQLFLRHAKNHASGVIEEPLIEYLKSAVSKDIYAFNVVRFIESKSP